MSSFSRLSGAALLAAMLASAPRAHAQTRCSPIDGGDSSLEAQDAEARLDAIRAVMRDQASRGRTWTRSWIGIGLGLTALGWAQFPFVDADKRLPQAIISIAPLFIPAQLAVFPLRVSRDDDALEAYLDATASSGGVAGPCLRLARAEELFEDAADDEHWHDSLGQHISLVVLTAVYTAFLAVAFHDTQYTLVDGAGSLVVGELQLLTQPNGAVDALAKYRRGDLAGVRASASAWPTWSLAPLGVAPGASVLLRF